VYFRFKKLIAIQLSLCLIWTSGSTAEAILEAAAPSASKPLYIEFAPPPRLGAIVDSSKSLPSAASQPFVVLIQDLHVHYGVQKNIAGILEFLAQKLGKDDAETRRHGDTVKKENISPRHPVPASPRLPFALAVEGASGPIDSSVLALFPDPKIRRASADYLMREGELTGAEYFAIQRGLPRSLVGVDQKEYYELHRDLFRKTFQDRDRLVGMLRGIEADIRLLRPRVYSKELMKFQRKQDAFAAGKMGAENAVAWLESEAAPFGMDVQALYRSPPEKLFADIESLTFILKIQKAAAPLEKNLVQVERDLALLLKVADLRATEADVRSLGPRLNQFTALCKALLKANGFKRFDERKARDLISSSIDYYALAMMRNKPMVENTLALMADAETRRRGDTEITSSSPRVPPSPCHRVVVLVAGGFHTAQIVQMLREKKVNYVVITPAVDEISEAQNQLYIKRLNGEYLRVSEIKAAVGEARTGGWVKSRWSRFWKADRANSLAVEFFGARLMHGMIAALLMTGPAPGMEAQLQAAYSNDPAAIGILRQAQSELAQQGVPAAPSGNAPPPVSGEDADLAKNLKAAQETQSPGVMQLRRFQSRKVVAVTLPMLVVGAVGMAAALLGVDLLSAASSVMPESLQTFFSHSVVPGGVAVLAAGVPLSLPGRDRNKTGDALKRLGIRDGMDEHAQSRLILQHPGFIAKAQEKKSEFKYGAEVKIIRADLPLQVPAYHLWDERDMPIIVVDYAFPPSAIEEAVYHEVRASQWIEEGVSPMDAHVLASAEQVMAFSRGGRLTPYHFSQLLGMNAQRLSAIVEEDEPARKRHHAILAKAGLLTPLILEYEQVLRAKAAQQLRTITETSKKAVSRFLPLESKASLSADFDREWGEAVIGFEDWLTALEAGQVHFDQITEMQELRAGSVYYDTLSFQADVVNPTSVNIASSWPGKPRSQPSDSSEGDQRAADQSDQEHLDESAQRVGNVYMEKLSRYAAWYGVEGLVSYAVLNRAELGHPWNRFTHEASFRDRLWVKVGPSYYKVWKQDGRWFSQKYRRDRKRTLGPPEPFKANEPVSFGSEFDLYIDDTTPYSPTFSVLDLTPEKGIVVEWVSPQVSSTPPPITLQSIIARAAASTYFGIQGRGVAWRFNVDAERPSMPADNLGSLLSKALETHDGVVLRTLLTAIEERGSGTEAENAQKARLRLRDPGRALDFTDDDPNQLWWQGPPDPSELRSSGEYRRAKRMIHRVHIGRGRGSLEYADQFSGGVMWLINERSYFKVWKDARGAWVYTEHLGDRLAKPIAPPQPLFWNRTVRNKFVLRIFEKKGELPSFHVADVFGGVTTVEWMKPDRRPDPRVQRFIASYPSVPLEITIRNPSKRAIAEAIVQDPVFLRQSLASLYPDQASSGFVMSEYPSRGVLPKANKRHLFGVTLQVRNAESKSMLVFASEKGRKDSLGATYRDIAAKDAGRQSASRFGLAGEVSVVPPGSQDAVSYDVFSVELFNGTSLSEAVLPLIFLIGVPGHPAYKGMLETASLRNIRTHLNALEAMRLITPEKRDEIYQAVKRVDKSQLHLK
jgi:hypothetical protein